MSRSTFLFALTPLLMACSGKDGGADSSGSRQSAPTTDSANRGGAESEQTGKGAASQGARTSASRSSAEPRSTTTTTAAGSRSGGSTESSSGGDSGKPSSGSDSGKPSSGGDSGKPSGGGSSAKQTGGASGTTVSTTTRPTGDGSCDSGSASTEWATECPTTAVACTSGTWTAGGPDPDHSGFALKAESAHFAVYSDEDISAATAKSATEYLESTVWPTYFGAPIYFKEPYCSEGTKYKASIHVHSDWGLTGGAWGAGRMGMWIGTGGLSDHWGLAHEFMHSVQSVSGGQSCSASNTCGWIYESHANFMPHQLPEYRTDVHCSELLVNATHLYLGSTRDRYCNWQFMEYLKDKYCYSAVNAIWTATPAADPFTAIMNHLSWSIAQLNDFMGEWAMHNVTWDYQNPPPTSGGNQGATYRSKYGSITDTSQTTRRLRLTKLEPVDTDYASNRRFATPFYWAPQRFGYNVIRLYPEASATRVTVTFRGVTEAQPSPDWRWGLVATDAAMTKPRYSSLQSGADTELTFCVNPDEPLFLVVTATPSTKQTMVWDQAYNTVPRYPYMIQLGNAWPDGFKAGKPDDCPSGLTRAANGGGCAPAGTTVYVGPYATVLSGATVSGDARIEDHAIVARGTVSGGTVGAMTLIGNQSAAFKMTAGTAKTTFYPLGFFEANQGLSGGTLIGDVEYRGDGLSRSSGTCSGFVDNATCTAPGSDKTPAPPYSWR